MGRKALSSRDFQFASGSANGRPRGLNFRRSRGLILLRPSHAWWHSRCSQRLSLLFPHRRFERQSEPASPERVKIGNHKRDCWVTTKLVLFSARQSVVLPISSPVSS